MQNNIIGIISKPILTLSEVMIITGRGRDYCRAIMDKVVLKHQKFYNEYFSEYRCKYIKTIHLYEALGYSDEEYYNIVRKK